MSAKSPRPPAPSSEPKTKGPQGTTSESESSPAAKPVEGRPSASKSNRFADGGPHHEAARKKLLTAVSSPPWRSGRGACFSNRYAFAPVEDARQRFPPSKTATSPKRKLTNHYWPPGASKDWEPSAACPRPGRRRVDVPGLAGGTGQQIEAGKPHRDPQTAPTRR